MNVIQLVMLFIAGGFIFAIIGVDRILKENQTAPSIRKKVSTVLLVLAVINEVLLLIVLWKFSLL